MLECIDAVRAPPVPARADAPTAGRLVPGVRRDALL
jgi:hypothetical protein